MKNMMKFRLMNEVPPEGNAEGAGQAGDVTITETTEVNTEAPPEVPNDYYKTQFSSAKAEAKAAKEAAEAAKAEVERMRVAQLTEKENYKELWEHSEEKRKQAEARNADINKSLSTNAKLDAIRKEALKAGIDERALDDLDMLDTSMLEIETTSMGRHQVHGAKEFVETLKEQRGHWFPTNKAPNLGKNLPDGAYTEKKYTPSELLKLEKTNPAAYRAAVNKLMQKN
jgi:hypothetical protein